MDYREAVSYLESLVDYERTPAAAAAARTFNLDRMRRLLAAAGDPHRDLKCLHIAGTKGKGSTAAMAASILQAAGHRVGLYSSPHLVSFRERLRLNGQLVSESAVAALTEKARPWIEALRSEKTGAPSFFEAYTLLSFLHFREQGAEIAVLETGLGGRLDATNVITPLACAITRIARDHMLELGDTLAQIAREKAGIIKPGVPVVSSPQKPEALEVIRAVCQHQHAPLYIAGEPGGPKVSLLSASMTGQVCRIDGLARVYDELALPLAGEHQLWNAAVAVALIELVERAGFPVGEPAIREGLARVRWPGRFQVIEGSPQIVLDVAHDEASAQALVKTLRAFFPDRRLSLVFGIYRDKEAEAMAAALAPICAFAALTASRSPRAMPREKLWERVNRFFPRCEMAESVAAALDLAKREAGRGGLVLVTGSLSVVGEAMEALGVEVV